ncbi:hypothetical protein N039_11370 [Staphylococcus sp. EGD-HP3]|nr:hypothetical protein N039_11370 [Staphylococcus sp. EGD-HP3]
MNEDFIYANQILNSRGTVGKIRTLRILKDKKA